MNKITYSTIMLMMLSTATVFAAGFGLNEESARGNAMQGAMVGSSKDVSAVYYNPANLVELEKATHAMFGITFARPDYNTYALGKCTDQDERIYMLPHFYASTPAGDDFVIGFGEYTEYGLGTHYENSSAWPLAADSSLTTMYCFTLNPSVAWKATDDLSFGVGLRIMYLNLLSDRMVPAYGSYLKMDVDDWSLSYLASVAYQLTDSFRVGVVYRAQTDFHEKGEVTLSAVDVGSGVEGDISMPQSVMIGFNWQALEKLELGFNATYVDWSCVKSLDQHFANPAFPDQSAPHNWHDTWRFSVGAEYKFATDWAFQCGYTHDLDPTDAGYANTMCPPGDRDQLGFGFSYDHGNWKIAADYMLVLIHSTDREIHGVETHFRDLKSDTLGLSYSISF